MADEAFGMGKPEFGGRLVTEALIEVPVRSIGCGRGPLGKKNNFVGRLLAAFEFKWRSKSAWEAARPSLLAHMYQLIRNMLHPSRVSGQLGFV